MALIPPFCMDSVVAIGVPVAKGTQWVATGFLYGHHVSGAGAERRYRPFLVTNRHVFAGADRRVLRFNALEGEPTRSFVVDLKDAAGKPIWFAHPDADVDVAVLPIAAKALEDGHLKFSLFQSDDHCAGVARMKDLGVHEGDGAFVLGFPLGQVGGVRNVAILRGGHIARIQDLLAGAGKNFLVDALIFPGNSGGPVISKPEMVSIQGSKSQNAAYLIGVVAAFIPYVDVALSQQTQRPRITFEDNSGLAVVFPVDAIVEVVATILRKGDEKEKVQEARPVEQPAMPAPASPQPPTPDARPSDQPPSP